MPLGFGGGDYFTPVVGRYVGQFLGISDGKPQTYPDGKTAIPAIWKFNLYNTDGTPVPDTKHPELATAIAEGMSSQTVGFGKDGRPSKGRTWLTAILASKGIPFGNPTTVEEVAALVEAAKGGFSYLTFATNGKQKVILAEIEPMVPQPGAVAAPVAPPPVAFAAPVPAAAPTFPVPAATAVAPPLPVPAGTPFVPTPVPPAAVEGITMIPAMPFPVVVQ